MAMPNDDQFQEQAAALAAADSRYAAAAYEFVREAVTHTAKQCQAAGGGPRQHITGRQLLEGFRALALERFGCLALEVLADWGLRRTDDVGAVVFRLVRHGLLGANENDSPADFAAVYDFEETFGAPFRAAGGGAKSAAKVPPVM